MADRKFDRHYIEAQEWGALFLREMDLVIAANTLAGIKSGESLTQAEMSDAVAERVIGLDQDAMLWRRADIEVPTDGNSWDRLDRAKERLSGAPRGHWSLVCFHQGDGPQYSRIISDGLGNVTEDKDGWYGRRQFVEEKAESSLYSALISYMVFIRKEEIKKEIAVHSFRESGLRVGSPLGASRINGRNYSKVEIAAIDSIPGSDINNVTVTCTRRGGRDVFSMPESEFLRFVTDVVAPEKYEEVDGKEDRVHEKLTSEGRSRRSSELKARFGGPS